MRFIRSLILVLGAALPVASCAQQPAGFVASPPAGAHSGTGNAAYGMVTPAPAGTSRIYMAAPTPPRGLYGTGFFGPPPAGAPDSDTPSAANPYKIAENGAASSSAPSYGGAPYAVPPAAAPAPTFYPSGRAPTTPYAAAPYAPARSPPVAYAPPPIVIAAAAPTAYATAPAATVASEPAAPEPRYTLDTGDRLRIVVFGQDGLTNSYLVSAGGNIDMPLIGPVAARGDTPEQLAARVSAKLRDGFIREPHVAVEIEAYRPFFILGEVTAPGQYPYVANMTAETAVAIAGGFTPRALHKNILLSRNYNGRSIRLSVPLTFPLRPGDTINVQERWF
jgi:protein involved in polysaccharide export with SLBB domain